jgi:glycosyltransferase involved in cell wall biosynthesis
METKKISVIVPVYNVEKYLDKCIYSIVNQSYHNLEIIIIDDGSNDNSPHLCDKWSTRDSRIKVFHKNNEGQSIARNFGLRMSSGDYIAFVDSDDFIELNAYEIILQECIKRDLDVAFFSYDRVNYDGLTIDSINLPEQELFIGKDEVRNFCLNLVGRSPREKSKRAYTTSASMSLFKASIIRNSGLQFVNVREVASEDLLFNLQFALKSYSVGCFPYIFYHYLVNTNSTTTTYNDKKYLRMTKLLEEVKKICDSNFDKQIYEKHFLSQVLRIYKIAMKQEIKSKDSICDKIRKLNSYCRSPWMKMIYTHPETKYYPIRELLYIKCMQYRFLTIFFFVY